MMAPSATPATATAAPLRGSRSRRQRDAAERSGGNKSNDQLAKHRRSPRMMRLGGIASARLPIVRLSRASDDAFENSSGNLMNGNSGVRKIT
jgi:hypothetical protein